MSFGEIDLGEKILCSSYEITKSQGGAEAGAGAAGAGAVVVAGVEGGVNLAARTSKGAWCELGHDARLSLEALKTQGPDAFSALFLTPLPAPLKFDLILVVGSCIALVVLVERLSCGASDSVAGSRARVGGRGDSLNVSFSG